MNNMNKLIKNAHGVSTVITYNRLWGIDDSPRYDEILPNLGEVDIEVLAGELIAMMEWSIGLNYHDLPDIAPILYDCTEEVWPLTAGDYLVMHVIDTLYTDMANETLYEVIEFCFVPERNALVIKYGLADEVEKTTIPLGGFMETLKLFSV